MTKAESRFSPEVLTPHRHPKSSPKKKVEPRNTRNTRNTRKDGALPRISRIQRFRRAPFHFGTCLSPQHFAQFCRGQPPLSEDPRASIVDELKVGAEGNVNGRIRPRAKALSRRDIMRIA